MKKIIIIIFFALAFYSCSHYSGISKESIYSEIEKGNFTKAEKLIKMAQLKNSFSIKDQLELNFETERMERIRLDFNKSEEDILKYLAKYYPNIKSDDLKKWEDNLKLEVMIIDGDKKYFSLAGRNLFRLDKDAQKVKINIDGESPDKLDEFLSVEIPDIIKVVKQTNKNLVKPVKLTLDYTVTLDKNVIPEGELIRCWLPYPRGVQSRQANIKLISIEPKDYILADQDNLQRSIYVEKITEKDNPTIFKMKLSFDAFSEWYNITPDIIKPYNKESDTYKKFTSENLPHIQFTNEIKEMSSKIIGNEKNPYLIAKKFFTFIDENYPWASAREYSTIQNIPMYIVKNGHGDCGIKTLLFMTLCRYNGIPAKWQSGWMLHPPEVNLHDWAEIYFEGIGWVPVDQSFGLMKSTDEETKYFFLSGIDSYRFIVNDGISEHFSPEKIFPRSETVDFQRGELEWRGGNIYFDKWNYDMKVDYSK